MDDHLKGANDLGYPDIRIRIFQIFGPYKAILKAGMDDHLKGTNVLWYPHPDFSDNGPNTAILKARKVKLGVNDPFQGMGGFGYPDIST